MATRVRIAAAAACLVIAGILVGGVGTVLASADPGTAQSGDGGGAATDPAADGASPSPAGQVPPGAPTAGATPDAGATVAPPKPTSPAGDGRGGMPLDGAEATPTPVPPSKQSERGGATPPQTKASPTAIRPAQESTPVPTPGATDQPVDEKLPPADPDDPEEHPGWQWWPWCWPTPPGTGLPPGNGSSPGTGNGGGGVSSGKPPIVVGVPKPPPLPVISVDPAVNVVSGLATAALDLPLVPLTIPIIVPPMGAGAGAGGGAGGNGVAPRPGVNPPAKAPPPRAREQSPPAFSASNGAPPAAYRVGYGEYLRTAGVRDMAAVAVPGVTGILALTFVGGLIGFRQARAGRAVRANGTARFMG